MAVRYSGVKLFLHGLLLAVATMGCSAPRLPELGPRYQPANVHAVSQMPKNIRRVALLPIARHTANPTMESASESLHKVLESELRKLSAFEVVTVTPAQMQTWTGKHEWRVDEALAPQFFDKIRLETGCEAILFPTLTAFNGYPPLSIGWDLRLVACADRANLWAVDEVLDGSHAPIARSARDYSRANHQSPDGDDSLILQSPARFARFTCSVLLNTLPPRQNPLKESAGTSIPGQKQLQLGQAATQ